MLKNVLYGFLIFSTAVRLADVVYLLLKESTNVPAAVLVSTSIMIVYGVILIAKKFINKITLKQLMCFYIVQMVIIAFNLFYIAVFCPLHISVPEAVAAGTFLDILINCCIVYLCTKHLRSRYFVVVDSEVQNSNG